MCTFDPGFTSTGMQVLRLVSVWQAIPETLPQTCCCAATMEIMCLTEVQLAFAGACQSQITFIDGKQGVLVYRGYVPCHHVHE